MNITQCILQFITEDICKEIRPDETPAMKMNKLAVVAILLGSVDGQQKEKLTVSGVAATLGINHSVISRTVSAMEAQGFIVSKRVSNRGKQGVSKEIHLAPKYITLAATSIIQDHQSSFA